MSALNRPLSTVIEEESNNYAGNNSNANNRPPSIVEIDADQSRNPLQEALDAIRTLAEDGDFSDSELMVPGGDDEKVRKVSYDRDMDKRPPNVEDDSEDDNDDYNDEDDESPYENMDDPKTFRAISADRNRNRPLNAPQESPPVRSRPQQFEQPLRTSSSDLVRRASLDKESPKSPYEKDSPVRSYKDSPTRSYEKDSPSRSFESRKVEEPPRRSLERESPSRTSPQRESPSRGISLKDRLFSRNIHIEKEEDHDKERRRSGSLDVVREAIEEEMEEENVEENKENRYKKKSSSLISPRIEVTKPESSSSDKAPIVGGNQKRDSSTSIVIGDMNKREPVIEEPFVERRYAMLCGEDDGDDDVERKPDEAIATPTIAARRAQPPPNTLDLSKVNEVSGALDDERPLPTSSRNSNVGVVAPSARDADEPDRPPSFRDRDELALPATSSGGVSSGYNLDKIMEPSAGATGREYLLPCPTCGRTFNRESLERHMKICEKVTANASRRAVNASPNKPGATSISSPGPARRSFRKKKSSNIEDEFRECPHCHRKFGHKPFDRHVEFCEQKARRLQTSPTKDLVALAKLHARTHYRPKTPVRSEHSPVRKISLGTCDSPLPPSVLGDMEYQSQFGSRGNSVSRSESRNSHVTVTLGSGRRSSQERKISNISSLTTADHTRETDTTKFIRAATGRGSIKRGPAPTKASQLRELAKQEKLKRQSEDGEFHGADCAMSVSLSPATVAGGVIGNSPFVRTGSLRSSGRSGRTPNLAQARSKIDNRTPASFRSRTSSPSAASRYSMSNSFHAGSSGYGGGYGSQAPSSSSGYSSQPSPMYGYSFQPVVRPSAVRPSPSPNSSYRREPEGSDNGGANHRSSSAMLRASPGLGVAGGYDHAAEYDPYQSAARQMQELLFGTGGGDTSPKKETSRVTSSSPGDLRPSTNSAFEKYIPSTADINTKMNTSFSSTATPSANNNSGKRGSVGVVSPFNASSSSAAPASGGSSRNTSGVGLGGMGSKNSPKVARFCHECGNPFALPDIRFCCECGVKRLYC